MRKNTWLVALMLVVVMMFGTVGTVEARTPTQILADVHYMNSVIDKLEQQGQISTGDVFCLQVDLGNLATADVITLSVYTNGDPNPQQINTFPTQNYTWKYVEQQLVKYGLGNIGNVYRAEPLNTDITCKTYFPDQSQRDIIPFYASGPFKTEAIAELYNGIPNCLEITYHPPGSGGKSGSSGSMSQPIAPIETPVADAIQSGNTVRIITAIFSIGDTSFKSNGKTISMDVVPYVKNDRTYVPVRYLAYAVGVGAKGITWMQDTQQVIINSNGTTIAMTIGSKTMTVNNEPVEMDVAPEIINNRTMLPARWVVEALGAEVEWDSTNYQATITLKEQAPQE